MRTLSEAEVQEAVSRYHAGESTQALASAFRCRTTTISDALKSAGVTVHSGKFARAISAEQEPEIIRRYLNGDSMATIAVAYGCAAVTVGKILRQHGVNVHHVGAKGCRWKPGERENMARRWNAGEAQAAIAADYGLSQGQVSRLLVGMGTKPPRWSPRREQHHSWRGGTFTHPSGYIMVMVDDDDPMRPMVKHRGGYVMEHRLVMARHLGRPLASSEHVHHINGDRKDNRLGNLQLMRTRHGAGVVYRCRCCGSTDVEAVSILKEGI